jgi:hypothetical protein
MFTSFRFWIVIALIAVAIGAYRARGPYETRLPFSVDELSTIESELNQLPDDERELVIDYMKRSNGDYLPASMGDPDNPLTARTFREAIALQKAFRVRQGADDRAADERRRQRDAKLAPLRRVTEVRVLRREILSGDQIYANPHAAPSSAKSSDSYRVLVVTYQLRNLSPRALASVRGNVEIVNALGTRMARCYFDHTDPIAVGSSTEVRCGQANKPASPDEIAFTQTPMSAFTLTWEPIELKFADGAMLASGI